MKWLWIALCILLLPLLAIGGLWVWRKHKARSAAVSQATGGADPASAAHPVSVATHGGGFPAQAQAALQTAQNLGKTAQDVAGDVNEGIDEANALADDLSGLGSSFGL